jgi:hypothetical protein
MTDNRESVEIQAIKAEPNSTVIVSGVDKPDGFKRFCAESWTASIKLVDNARRKQQERNQRNTAGYDMAFEFLKTL